MSASEAGVQTQMQELQAVPLTLEGYSVLHQMMRIRWSAWRHVPRDQKVEIIHAASSALASMETNPSGPSAMFSLLGHKGDLMFVHFRNSFEELNQAELALAKLAISEYLEPATSYLSIIELGLYESSMKTYKGLVEQGIEPHSDEWKKAIAEVTARQAAAMHSRASPSFIWLP